METEGRRAAEVPADSLSRVASASRQTHGRGRVPVSRRVVSGEPARGSAGAARAPGAAAAPRKSMPMLRRIASALRRWPPQRHFQTTHPNVLASSVAQSRQFRFALGWASVRHQQPVEVREVRSAWRDERQQPPHQLLRGEHQRHALLRSYASRPASLGIEDVPSAPRSPWQNPFAERIVDSIGREVQGPERGPSIVGLPCSAAFTTATSAALEQQTAHGRPGPTWARELVSPPPPSRLLIAIRAVSMPIVNIPPTARADFGRDRFRCLTPPQPRDRCGRSPHGRSRRSTPHRARRERS